MSSQAHPWFRCTQWDMLYEMEAAYRPTVNGDLDTQNFEKFAEVSMLELMLWYFIYNNICKYMIFF